MNASPEDVDFGEPQNPYVRDVFVAMGSNVGDRLAHLRGALGALHEDADVRVLAASPIYESPAMTASPAEAGPDFLNAVVKLSTTLDAGALLERLQAIERRAGRRREEERRWAPRTLDLDILIFGDEVIRREQLTVPHPRLAERRFVLKPLADLASDYLVPAPFKRTVAELLDECPDPDRLTRWPSELSTSGT